MNKKYRLKLERDYLIYGSCYQEFVAYNWFQRFWRRINGLPIDRKRVDSKDITYCV